MQPKSDFIKKSTEEAFANDHQAILQNSLGKYDHSFRKGLAQFTNIDEARKKVSYYRMKGISDMEKNLVEFENRFLSNGGKLYWANETAEALSIIIELIESKGAHIMVKSKTMVSEELEVNLQLKQKAEIIETDLGEYIIQLRDERPSHITAPALHLSKEEIVSLFVSRFGLAADATAEDLMVFVRKLLRDQFIKADVGMSGANFLLADIGGIALTENEGNASLTTSWPRIHIVVAGIEKIQPSVSQLGLLWPMLATHATGQKLSVYNHIITGPKKNGEMDGPEEMHLILLDNRRSEILKDKELRKALSCIKCGACLNVCPVYKTIAGHTYGAVYNGPIGAVITPHLKFPDNYFHLSFASTLCQQCTFVCPANIPIHELLLVNRNFAVRNSLISTKEKNLLKIVRYILKSRKNLERFGPSIKNSALRILLRKNWGRYKTTPTIAPKSFNKIWRDEHGIK